MVWVCTHEGIRGTWGWAKLMHGDATAWYRRILSKKVELIIHSIYGVKRFHSLRGEFHSILTPVE